MKIQKFGVVTLFPEAFSSVLATSILSRAVEAGLLEIHFEQIRDHAQDKHRRVDDAPYGGGAGQLMMAAPVLRAIAALKQRCMPEALVILLGPCGQRFVQGTASALAGAERDMILLCGHYEGIDERVRKHIDMELSIGDYVLTGGELAAMVVIDAVSRLRPGVLGNAESSLDESFSDGLLEYPQYTRPWDLNGDCPPEVLRSGNHAAIASWRKAAALERTKRVRPDLLSAKSERNT